MKSFQGFDFNSINNVSDALQQINDQIRVLAGFVGECDPLEDNDRKVFVDNIAWLKRFYETAEKKVLDSD
jgi:hypothetical protein